jgi:hypothetical protein
MPSTPSLLTGSLEKLPLTHNFTDTSVNYSKKDGKLQITISTLGGSNLSSLGDTINIVMMEKNTNGHLEKSNGILIPIKNIHFYR